MHMPRFSPEHRHTIASIGVLLVALGVGTILLRGSLADSYVSNASYSVKQILKTFDLRKPMGASDPIRLRIPDIYIDTNFVQLGLADDGSIEVPKGYTEIGWYENGPTPGELGPAVVLGHVDSYKGPGVFIYLGQLTPGDYIYVDRADGTTATFRVTELERYDRDAFPTEKVYGNIDHAGLRLITCSGTFNKHSLEYNRVLVVYAALVEEEKAP